MTTAKILNITPHAGHHSADGDLSAVERCMEAIISQICTEPLAGIVREHLETGGKRLRARLALAAVEALGVDPAAGVGLAAACELLHNATLIHDDLQDGDTVRRGRPTTWVTHGPAQAINAGDLMLMLPTLALEHVEADDAVRWRLAQAMARQAARTACGQALELTLPHQGTPSWGDYAEAAEGKTGAFFSLPVEGAALIAGFSRAEAQALGRATEPLGVLFQLQDDVLDLYGDKGRAQPGNDIREGKISALVVAHLELHPEDTERVLGILRAPREETTDAQVSAMAQLFAQQGALEEVSVRAQRLYDQLHTSPTLHRTPALRAIVLDIARKLFEPLMLAVAHPLGQVVANG